MSRMTTTLMTTLLLAGPAALSAQDGEAAARATTEAAAQAATPDARIAATMAAAAEARIPTSLLESKVREGRSKGVPADRVATAVEARFQALVRARDALQKGGAEAVTEGQLLVASEALRAGVSETALLRVTREAPSERRAVATAVLTDLVRLGYGSDAAMGRVEASLSSGPDALVNLRAEAAASLRARGLLSTEVVGGVRGGGGVDF